MSSSISNVILLSSTWISTILPFELLCINGANIFPKKINQSDLRFGGFNIGYEIHGEYNISMSFKNLSLTSTKK